MLYHTQEWYIRTPIENGEIFSSWLIRSALDMGCSPLVLVEALWGNWRAFTIDLDKGINTDRLDVLLSHCLEDKQTISKTMLSSVIPHLNNSWILVLGQRNRSNFSGRQVCTECLHSDGSSPYLRLVWRMGWHIGCEKHHVKLIDHCPVCGITIQPFKIDLEHGSLAKCSSCSYNFIEYKSQDIDLNILDFQKNADCVLKTGSGFYNQKNILSSEWFEIARAWLSEIRLLIDTKNIKLIQMFNSLGVNLEVSFPITPLSFEYLNTHERTILLSMLNQIMKIPCDLIVNRCSEYGISNANFWDNRKKLPRQLLKMKAAMVKPVRKHSSHRLVSEINQPKSKKFVQHKWLKLLRKLKKTGVSRFD